MKKPRQSFEGPFSFLASKQLALGLFLLFSLSLVPGTFAEENYHISGISRVIAGCMALNLAFCTVSRMRMLPGPVLVMHAGSAMTMVGALMSSIGFIGTVNIYEGTSVDTVYRWDREEEVPLGATLTVRKIDIEYYPTPVRVGVLRGEDKAGLYELKTGGQFDLGPYRVRADALEMPAEVLKLSIFREGRLIGTADTNGARDVPLDFPYGFRLVGFKEPAYKRIGINIALTQGAEPVAEGVTEVNSPMHWNGLYFYHTNLEWDDFGNAYAGIQIVRDPGKPVVYLGFAVLLMGSLMWAYKKFNGRGNYPSAAPGALSRGPIEKAKQRGI